MEISKAFLVAVFCFLSFISAGQGTVSGYIRDETSKENLIGAFIYSQSTRQGATTNTKGYFSLHATAGDSLVVSYLGYQAQKIFLSNPPTTLLEINMKQSNETLNEVEVRAKRDLVAPMTSLSGSDFKAIPSIGAVNDVIKAIQLFPGITAQNEGSSQLIVRGGRPGENLYLLDNIPLIYVNHLGGFYSVFNSDIINRLDVYKDAFPAKYGGKLSSVVSITQREGNAEAFKGNFSIGPMAGSLLLEGPTKIKNLTYIVSFRKTLIDALMALGTSLSNANDFIFFYGFHDFNSKITYKPDLKNTFSLSLYQGDDYLNYWTKFSDGDVVSKSRRQTIWGNWMLSGQWKRAVNQKLFSESSLSYLRYRLKYKSIYRQDDRQEESTFDNRFKSVLEEVRFAHSYEQFIKPNFSLQYGVQASRKTFNPNSISSKEKVFASGEIDYAYEGAIFAEAAINFFNYSNLVLGPRLNGFKNGKYTSLNLAPRATLSIGLNRTNWLTAKYTKANQYAYLLFTSGFIANNEIWIPAYEEAPAASSTQYSVGYKSDSFIRGLNLQVEVYQKYLNNITVYREDISNIFGDTNWKNKLVNGGEGRSRGLELLMKKSYGLYQGFISYTLARTEYNFGQINEGKTYVYEFDRTHTFSLNLSRQLNRNLLLSANWVYQTGLPFTPAIGKKLVPNPEDPSQYNEVLIYGERNSARLRDYHRLDLGLVYNTLSKNGRDVTWTFSIYNTYSRQNAYTNFYNTNSSLDYSFSESQAGSLKQYQASFFPIIPSFTYALKFEKGNRKNEE